MGTTLPYFAVMASTVAMKSEFSLLTALTNMNAGTLFSRHISRAFSVPTVRAPDALVTTIALSAAERAATISPSKSKKPGTSRMLILTLFLTA